MSAWKVTVLLLSLFVFGARFAAGQEDAAPAANRLRDAAPAVATDTLSDEQNQVAEKYRRLEDLIFKMADFEATSNPRRAALLKQAYKQSKDRLTQSQLAAIVALLSQKQYKRALDGQEIARKDLQELLQLLLSEDRSDRLKTETQRMKDHIKELQRLQRLQRSVRGQTEGGADPKELAEKQSKVADRTGELAKQLEDEDSRRRRSRAAARQAGGNRAPGSQRAGGRTRRCKTRSPGRPSHRRPMRPVAALRARHRERPRSHLLQAPPSAPDDQSPAKKRVREAEQKMREAQQRLEEAKRSESLEKQTEALQKLQEAIAELEEVLRQLREEEMERVLALLEGRFRQMLEEEIKIYEATQRLDQTPEDQRGRALDIRAGKLAFDQRKVAGQADRCLTLLLEEGSSIAFPEVVQQIRDDMETVSDRLAETKVGTITQDLEQEIIDSLEEMIAAFQKAQQDMEKSRSAAAESAW